MPAISVLLPVRDAQPWLAASLASLWRQTFVDFEVVAVDDGSTDGSGELLDRMSAREPRLRVAHSAARGLPSALNLALARARAPLVARHDADDLSHRDRFALQHAFLARHPRIAVVGSRLRLFPHAAAGAGMRRWAAWHNALLSHDAIAREVLIDSPLAHGTAMMRRRVLERVGGWAERGWAEDLDLWVRLLRAGARFEKLPHTLYGWRQHPGSSTRRDRRYRHTRFRALKLDALARGFLRGRRHLTVIGTGTSLDGWTRSLRAAGYRVTPASRRGPSVDGIAPLRPPLVLVFVAAPARAAWRRALDVNGRSEGRDFVFVA